MTSSQIHDYVRLTNIVLFAHLGVTEAEREVGQRIRLDLELGIDLGESSKSDQLRDTVSCESAYKTVERVVERSRHRLLETLAGDLLIKIFEEYPPVKTMKVVVCKLNVPFAGSVASAEVEMWRAR